MRYKPKAILCIKYAKGPAEHPIERLAEVWERLSHEIQAALTTLIEQIISSAKPEQCTLTFLKIAIIVFSSKATVRGKKSALYR